VVGAGATLESPGQVAGVWTVVSAGTDFTCALDLALAPWCWGAGGTGQLGDNDLTNAPAPRPVVF
jgi:hypothetical protein